MSLHEQIKLFEQTHVRSVYDAELEQWFFSIVDVISILTDSVDPKQYIKKLRSRDPELDSNWGTICTLVPMKGMDGKNRKQMAATPEQLFRIIQSVPSKKAESFKQWIELEAKKYQPELAVESPKMLIYSSDDGSIALDVQQLPVRPAAPPISRHFSVGCTRASSPRKVSKEGICDRMNVTTTITSTSMPKRLNQTAMQ